MRFFIREGDFKDRDDLLKLARFFPLCSLPDNKSKLEKKIQISKESFKHILPKEQRNYLFVLEDRKVKKVIGSSQILSYFGGNRSFCYFLKKKAGKSYLKLKTIKTGRHQIGGLILHPDYRRFPEKLGLQISAGRFLYIKALSKEFSNTIEVSLTSPINKKENGFWEETGSQYLKMSYSSALKVFQKNRVEFFSLFPKNLEFELDKLSSKAKHCLKQVHPQTLPVYKGLLKKGFHKTKHHHALDGGIYLEAKQKDISFLKKAQKKILKQAITVKKPSSFLISQNTNKGFICAQAKGESQKGTLFLKKLPPNFKDNEKAFILKFPF